jgi:serine/threonine protein kinase
VYMTPEVIRCEQYDEKCDVYSFGVILNEIISGEYPYIETDYSPIQVNTQPHPSELQNFYHINSRTGIPVIGKKKKKKLIKEDK